MDILVFVGLPYNKWMPINEGLKYTTNFKEFRFSKEDFFLEITENSDNTNSITIILPKIITIKL